MIMRGFDLDQLRSFAAVAAAGSITAAADGLCLSQSAVSEQIRKLEERAGTRLFLRSKAGVTPTPAGARLLRHAETLLALSEAAYLDLRGQGLEGEVRLAVSDYFRPLDVARALRRSGAVHPRLRLAVTMGKSAEIDAALAAGQADVGMVMRAVPAPDDGGRAIRREALHWVAAEGGSPPAGSNSLPLVLLSEGCSLHRLALRELERRAIPHHLAHTASGVAGLRLAVAAGLGVSCLNDSALGDGVARLGDGHGLPPLPAVEFRLSGERPGEPPLAAHLRRLLAEELG
jgi:DNA-binding transcriptional LysR family regulator